MLNHFQEPLKGSVLGDMKVLLRSFTDVCDAVFAVEIGLRFLGKTGGKGDTLLVPYLRDSLGMDQQISSNMAKVQTNTRLKLDIYYFDTTVKHIVMLGMEQHQLHTQVSHDSENVLTTAKSFSVYLVLA